MKPQNENSITDSVFARRRPVRAGYEKIDSAARMPTFAAAPAQRFRDFLRSLPRSR
jgi:hypothetical protein